MAPVIDMDAIDPYDCTPGGPFRKFKRQLLGVLSGVVDKSGSTLANCLLGNDMGGPAAGADPFPAPGAPVQDGREMRRLAASRPKQLFAVLYARITNEDFRAVMNENFHQDGRAAWGYIEEMCDTPMSPAEISRLEILWRDANFDTAGVGRTIASARDFAVYLHRINADFPVELRKNETELAEKFMWGLMKVSRHFHESTLAEYNLPVGSRRFEHPAPPAPPAPPAILPPGVMPIPPPIRHRHLTSLLAHYNEQWQSAVQLGIVGQEAPTRRPAVAESQNEARLREIREERMLRAMERGPMGMSLSPGA